MNIYFSGYLKSPFIKSNHELLKEDYEVTVFDLSKNASSFSQMPSFAISVLKELSRIKSADIVWLWYADYPAVPFVMLARLFGKPVFTNVAGWEVYEAPEINYGNQTKPFRGAVTRWILRNSRCICMSEAYRKIILEVEPDAKVSVIPGWVDTALCQTSLTEKHGIVTAYCDYNLAEYIKGISTFKEATQELDAAVLKDVPHKTLIEALQRAKVYCQLSFTESFGMTLLEAMACGCMPVVTDRDALPELVGDTGIIVPFGNAAETRRAIMSAFRMSGEPARQRAIQFSKDNTKQKIRDTIEVEFEMRHAMRWF